MIPRRTFISQLKALHRNVTCRSISLCQPVNNQQEEVELEQNPYFKKYAEKIKKAQAAASFNAPSMKPKTESRLRRETEQWKQNIALIEEKFSEKKKQEENRRGSKLPGALNELIHMDLLEPKTGEEISQIWMEHFKDKDCVSAVIPSAVFENKIKKIQEYPSFLYPLPKSQGYEFFLSQFEHTRCFFTSLINFQVHGDNAPWQLCLTFYSELKESKGIVLMTSEVDTSTMNVMEAHCLSQLQKLFYVNPTEDRLELLHSFNKNPDTFKYMDLVKAVEKSNMVVKGLV